MADKVDGRGGKHKPVHSCLHAVSWLAFDPFAEHLLEVVIVIGAVFVLEMFCLHNYYRNIITGE